MKITNDKYFGESNEKLSLTIQYVNDKNKKDRVRFDILYNFAEERVEEIRVVQAYSSMTLKGVVDKFLSQHDWETDDRTDILSDSPYVTDKSDSLGLYLKYKFVELNQKKAA